MRIPHHDHDRPNHDSGLFWAARYYATPFNRNAFLIGRVDCNGFFIRRRFLVVICQGGDGGQEVSGKGYRCSSGGLGSHASRCHRRRLLSFPTGEGRYGGKDREALEAQRV